MNKVVEKLKVGIAKVSDFFDTIYFAIALAAIELISYYLGLDLLIIIVVSLCISFAFLLKKNLNSSLVLFLFLSSMISFKNSPANEADGNNAAYYFQPQVYITCIIFAAIPVTIIIVRAIMNIVQKKVRIDAFFISTVALGVFFLTNGLFSNKYIALDTMFGAFMFFFFVVLLFAVIPYVSIHRESLKLISKQVAIYLTVPLIEMIGFYIELLGPGVSLKTRSDVFIGWGNRNTLGMIFAVTLQFLLYLIHFEENKKLKIVEICYALLVVGAIVATTSRQAYLFTFLLFTGYLVYRLSTSTGSAKKKLRFIVIFWVGLIFLGIIIGQAIGMLDLLSLNSISSRLYLWEDAYRAFGKNPIFGSGFFFIGGDPEIQLSLIMPYCCHNTILELLGACGFFGVVFYLMHRLIGLKKIFSDLTEEKVYPFMALAMIVLMSLLDIHLFDFFGSALYTILLAFSLSKSSEEDEKLVVIPEHEVNQEEII